MDFPRPTKDFVFLALGLALQGMLTNIAAGIMLL